jgi:hypothetical protein
VHREAEGSWLALQLLLAQGVLAQKHRTKDGIGAQQGTTDKAEGQPDTALYSPRQIIIAIGQEMSGPRQRGAPRYAERLHQARGEERPGRTSAKASRDWPRRKPYEPPKPPKLLTLTEVTSQ